MPVLITEIIGGSLADKTKLAKNFKIISINRHIINDCLDLFYYSSDDVLHIEYEDLEKQYHNITVKRNPDIPLGIEIENKKLKKCVNKCIFCFIDQMPPLMRESLYVKDDDPVFSFTHGNFITLTNLDDKYIKKIILQHISPLYISVHTTNPVLHRLIFRHSLPGFEIMKILRHLSHHNISFHTQIVVIPGYNDKKELRDTLEDLTDQQINTMSIGIVPVGLTKFRQGLPEIKKFTYNNAVNTLNIACKITKKTKFNRIYCADEIFLAAKKSIPPTEYYNDFEQLENGIGMVRLTINNWESIKDNFISYLTSEDKKLIFITGVLAFNLIKEISNSINNEIKGEKTDVISVKNNFFGEDITVSGLLTAFDIIRSINFEKNTLYALSSNIFNFNDLTLDNKEKEYFRAIASENNCSFLVIDELFREWDSL